MASNSSIFFSNSSTLHPRNTLFSHPSSLNPSRHISFPFSTQPHFSKPLTCKTPASFQSHLLSILNNNNNNNNNNGSGGGNGGGGGGGSPDSWGWWDSSSNYLFAPLICFIPQDKETPIRGGLIFLITIFICLYNAQLNPAFARTEGGGEEVVWEVRGGKWTKLLRDFSNDAFVIVGASRFADGNGNNGDEIMNTGINLWVRCKELCVQLMLPDGYPNSVTSDYLDYSLWRAVQGVASQVSGVLATQALLYAVGLGKGAIPTAAAINWVLKDGIGYLSKILLSKYGRHFDVNPKGWRLFADLLENAAFGLEILTPAFPHLFVPIGAAAGAGRSAATLIQAATRSCFFAGFAAQRNFAEVIAKGEAQGMVSKFIGIALGIALANCIGTSTPLAVASFTAVTVIHMYCNLKSYQAILIKSLNPYRASLVFSEYLLSGQIPKLKEVNDEEPLFAGMPLLNANLKSEAQSELLSVEAKVAAAEIDGRLQLGSKLSDIITSKGDAIGLFDLYKDEGYLLTEHRGKFCVVLKEGYTPKDMLKSLFHVNYLYWLEKNVGIESKGAEDDCKPGGKLQISLDYVQREFDHAKRDGSASGWLVDEGLIARPLPCRIRPVYADSAPTSREYKS